MSKFMVCAGLMGVHKRGSMVKRMRITAMAVLMSTFFVVYLPAAEDPVKWSAPMNQYPNQWSPSTPPPQYTYPYAYNQQGYPPGYGSYGGAAYWGYGTPYPGNYGQTQQGFSGNPYHHYYYR